MSLLNHQLELLAPARDAAIGIEAINHGADAVYIGGPGFGYQLGTVPRAGIKTINGKAVPAPPGAP